MNQEKEQLQQLVEKVGTYGDTLYELYKLKTMRSAANVAASHLTNMMLIIAYAVALLLFLFGASFWVGELLDNLGYGFLAVGGLLVLLVIVLHSNRNLLIKSRLSSAIMSQFQAGK